MYINIFIVFISNLFTKIILSDIYISYVSGNFKILMVTFLLIFNLILIVLLYFNSYCALAKQIIRTEYLGAGKV